MRKILIALVLLFSVQSSASHLISGNFTYEFVSQSGNQRTYKINLYLFRDVTGVNLPTTTTVYYKKTNQGTCSTLSLTQASVTTPTNTCNSTVNYAVHKFSANVTLDASSVYDFAYSTCCRPSAATNLSNPSSQSIYLTTRIVTSRPAGRSYNNSVSFIPRILAAPINTPTTFVINYPDPDGDSLSYEITNVKGGNASTLTPTAIAYMPGFSNTQPLGTNGTLSIDPASGTMMAQSSVLQNALVNIKIVEWDKDTTNTYRVMGISQKEFLLNFHNSAATPPAAATVDSAFANFASDTIYMSTSNAIYPNQSNLDSSQVVLVDPNGDTNDYVVAVQPLDNTFRNFRLLTTAFLVPGNWALHFDYNDDSLAFMGACNRPLIDSHTFTVDAPVIQIALPSDSIYGMDTVTYILQHSGMVDSVQWMVTGGSVEMAYGIDSVQIAWGISGNGSGELSAIAWSYGMSDTATISVNIYGIGIGENTLTFGVYPNPAREILNINGLVSFSYEVTDFLGRILLSGHCEQGNIPVDALPEGNYILKISKEGATAAQRFRVQK